MRLSAGTARPRPSDCPGCRGSGGRAHARSGSFGGLSWSGGCGVVEHAAARVEGQLLVRREIVPGAALACGKTDPCLDASTEALARRTQRQLRVDLQLARDVDGGEQHVAELVEALVAAGVALCRGDRLQLVELVAYRLQRPFDAREVEAGGGGAALHLAR